MTEDMMKDVATKTEELFTILEKIYPTLTEKEKEELRSLASGPVGLRDANRFNLAVEAPTRQEIMNARRELAGAIAAENWMDGFVFALQLMLIMGG